MNPRRAFSICLLTFLLIVCTILAVLHFIHNSYKTASEASLSRLYGGIHFRRANETGLASGRSIGQEVMRTALSPAIADSWTLY